MNVPNRIFALHSFKNYSVHICRYALIFFVVLLPITAYYIVLSPNDYQQDVMVKIMYIHVPMAWFSLVIYTSMFIAAIINITLRIKLASIFIVGIIPIGATFNFLTLITGSIWGKPAWGAWWVWDARLTSMLVLFLFYLCKMIMIYSSESLNKAEKPISIFCIIGFINVPIVKFSVNMWTTIHQQSSFIRLSGPSVDHAMITPLLLSIVTVLMYTVVVTIVRMKATIIHYSRKSL